MDATSALTSIPPSLHFHYHGRQPRVTTPREQSLNYAEARLVVWARWAKDHPEVMGYPKLSTIYKVMRRRAHRLGTKHHISALRAHGLTAKGNETLSFRPRTVGEVPEAISEVDAAVAVLGQLKRIIQVEYLTKADLPEEFKATEVRMPRAAYRRALRKAKLKVAELLE